MGNVEVKTCLVSDFIAEPIINDQDIVEYFINDRTLGFKISHSYYSGITQSKVVADYKHIVRGLILNNKWPKSVQLRSDDDLLRIINEYSYPKTPQEKLDNSFEFLFNLQTKDGQELDADKFWHDKLFSTKLFFKDDAECNFYFKALADKGLIKVRFDMTSEVNFMYRVNVTFDGFQYFNRLTNEGLKSTNCFVAMSFGDEMKPIRNAIKLACEKTGYTALLIDEIHGDADKTINDEIIANIKRSKFCIADFTEQRDGVYFESGYALGRGLKVIYTCEEKHFGESHFDTNHFPHIIYHNPSQLEERLIDKIEAWIND